MYIKLLIWLIFHSLEIREVEFQYLENPPLNNNSIKINRINNNRYTWKRECERKTIFTRKRDNMSDYEELKAKYRRISEAIDKAIKQDEPYEEFVDSLFRCMNEINETPEAKAEFERMWKEAESIIRGMDKI